MRHQLWKGIAAGVLLLSHSGIMAEAREAELLQILEVDMQHMGEPWQNEEWVNDPVVIRVKTNRGEVCSWAVPGALIRRSYGMDRSACRKAETGSCSRGMRRGRSQHRCCFRTCASMVKRRNTDGRI